MAKGNQYRGTGKWDGRKGQGRRQDEEMMSRRDIKSQRHYERYSSQQQDLDEDNEDSPGSSENLPSHRASHSLKERTASE